MKKIWGIIICLVAILFLLYGLQTTSPTKEKVVKEKKVDKIVEEEPIQEEEVAIEEAPLAQEVSYSIDESGYETISPCGGVYSYDGRTETYYSSNVLYHYNTPNWTADEQGFYRDANGYYVVAASDMEQGTVFACSMGVENDKYIAMFSGLTSGTVGVAPFSSSNPDEGLVLDQSLMPNSGSGGSNIIN